MTISYLPIKGKSEKIKVKSYGIRSADRFYSVARRATQAVDKVSTACVAKMGTPEKVPIFARLNVKRGLPSSLHTLPMRVQALPHRFVYILRRAPRDTVSLHSSLFTFHSSLFTFLRICTAFAAAPFLSWSPQHQRQSPLSSHRSRRSRPTHTVSPPVLSRGVG